MVVAEAASVSAAVDVAYLVIGQTVNEETEDSAMLRRIEEQAKNNSVLGAPIPVPRPELKSISS
jgi:hypothetical protein